MFKVVRERGFNFDFFVLLVGYYGILIIFEGFIDFIRIKKVIFNFWIVIVNFKNFEER